MSNNFLMKKARLQIDGPRPQKEEPGSTYNIWYHKNSYLPDTYETELIRAATRCDVENDSGKTKAKNDSYLCVHFIRGECCMGYDCRYFHHIPNQEEIAHIPVTKDVFGRDRHSTDKDDMSGVGNFNKENKTLFIGRIPAKASDIYNLVYKNFSEWGEIEEVNTPADKSLAFVRYTYRSSAEIAKEAMECQSFGFGDILQIRWAHDDPNPNRRKEKEKEEISEAKRILIKKATEMIEDDQSAFSPPMEYDAQSLSAPTQPVAQDAFLYSQLHAQQERFEQKLGEYNAWLDLPENEEPKEETPKIQQTKIHPQNLANSGLNYPQNLANNQNLASPNPLNFPPPYAHQTNMAFIPTRLPILKNSSVSAPPGIRSKKKIQKPKTHQVAFSTKAPTLKAKYKFPNILGNIERDLNSKK